MSIPFVLPAPAAAGRRALPVLPFTAILLLAAGALPAAAAGASTAPAPAEPSSATAAAEAAPAAAADDSTAPAAVVATATGPAAQQRRDEEPPPAPAAPGRRSFDDRVDVVGEATRTLESPVHAERRLATVAGGTDFVAAEEYLAGRAADLTDVLRWSPGVIAQSRFGAEEARISIRGSGLQRTFHGRGLKVLHDGIPLNLADGSFDMQAVEPLAAAFAEVYRGANGLRYGATTLGGAINFVSPSGFETAPWSARLEGGGFDYLRALVTHAGAGESSDRFFALSHSGQEGFREHARQSTQRAFANLGWQGGGAWENRTFLSVVRTDSELPGSLTRAQALADPEAAAPFNVIGDQKRDFDLFRLSNRTSWALSGDSRLDLTAFWSYKDLDHPIFQVLRQESHDVGVEARYERSLAGEGRRPHLVVGLAPTIGWLEDDRFLNVAGEAGARTAEGETRSTNLDAYGELRLPYGERWTLSLGAAASRASRDFDDRFLANGDQTDRQDFTGWSPKLGVLYEIATGVLFANVARSFEPPTFGELANRGGDGLLQLDAQTATSVEVGSRGRTGWLAWDAVLYHAWIDDELLALQDEEGNPLGTVNAGSTTHDGAELGASAALAETAAGDLRLDLVYTWTRLRFDGDPVFGDNHLAGLPEHLLRAGLSFTTPGGWSVEPSVEWAPSDYFVDHANTLDAPGYTLANLRLGRRADAGWTLFVEGRNLTDRRWIATTGVVADARGRDQALFFPGDGRSWYLGGGYRF
jgi:iron complex outermembrane recepter protein